MSTDMQVCPGSFHVILRLKGDQARVDLFHEILRRCDLGWPWKAPASYIVRTQQCDQCDGLIYSSPRCNPEDIKSAAKQASVGVKIVRFSPSVKCFTESEQHHRTRWVEIAEANRMYRSKEWLEKHAPTRVIQLPAAAAAVDPVILDADVLDPTKWIGPDGLCLCRCHDDGVDPKDFKHPTMFCCANMFHKHRLQPKIVAAVAARDKVEVSIMGPDGNVLVCRGIANDEHLIDHVMEAEREAAGCDAMLEDDAEPWGGLVN